MVKNLILQGILQILDGGVLSNYHSMSETVHCLINSTSGVSEDTLLCKRTVSMGNHGCVSDAADILSAGWIFPKNDCLQYQHAG